MKHPRVIEHDADPAQKIYPDMPNHAANEAEFLALVDEGLADINAGRTVRVRGCSRQVPQEDIRPCVIRFAKRAEADLEHIDNWITGDDGAGLAARIVEAILTSIELLELFSQLGRPGRRTGTRELGFPERPTLSFTSSPARMWSLPV